jgi:hypothetical protein
MGGPGSAISTWANPIPLQQGELVRCNAFKSLYVVLAVLLVSSSGLSGPIGDGGARGPPTDGPSGPDVTTWSDDFDDGTLVNTTIDTQVTGGQVQLALGQDFGLVASVLISTPPATARSCCPSSTRRRSRRRWATSTSPSRASSR